MSEPCIQKIPYYDQVKYSVFILLGVLESSPNILKFIRRDSQKVTSACKKIDRYMKYFLKANDTVLVEERFSTFLSVGPCRNSQRDHEDKSQSSLPDRLESIHGSYLMSTEFTLRYFISSVISTNSFFDFFHDMVQKGRILDTNTNTENLDDHYN
ncbi:hypothetical protein RF11_01301 [Thelohanellus kitauei]|uniref:Uncharacterized protein n=1 Tax=Thelohanellus kitauei TaxID=669202 RepID=A0A0C2MYN6_THEKT|nr:hypothetical protein RF11_01301 [Thelohanellus kitauei]